ncbi:MAG: hypothetical protein QOD92_1071 [Acidimicrobiaceae bacterium]|jgi:hypothetical protein
MAREAAQIINTVSKVLGQQTAEILLTVPGLDDESVIVVLIDKHGLTAEEAALALAAAKEAVP